MSLSAYFFFLIIDRNAFGVKSYKWAVPESTTLGDLIFQYILQSY